VRIRKQSVKHFRIQQLHGGLHAVPMLQNQLLKTLLMPFVRNAEVTWPAAGHEHQRRCQPLQLIRPAACTAAGAIETGAADQTWNWVTGLTGSFGSPLSTGSPGHHCDPFFGNMQRDRFRSS